MILGNESKLLEYLKTKEQPYYANDKDLVKEINVSVSSLKAYRNKLYDLGLLEFKAVFKDNVKIVGYQVKVVK